MVFPSNSGGHTRGCAFAREPERRKVAADARVSIDGAFYEVNGDLAGEEVLLWRGLFDHELFVEWNDKRYSPKALADLTNTRLPEIRRFLKGQLDMDRTDEFSTLMRKAGLPI